MNSVYQDTVNGVYCNTLPFPSRNDAAITIEQYKQMRETYKDETKRLNDKLKHDLFVEFGVEEHPKREKCWDLAWEYGHSNGLSEVCLYFEDFVQLLK